MNFFESRKPIDLSAIEDKSVRKKGQKIHATFLDINDNRPEDHTADLEKATQAVINLRNLISGGLVNDLGVGLQHKLESTIKAFNVDNRKFPEGFDIETGKFKKIS